MKLFILTAVVSMAFTSPVFARGARTAALVPTAHEREMLSQITNVKTRNFLIGCKLGGGYAVTSLSQGGPQCIPYATPQIVVHQ